MNETAKPAKPVKVYVLNKHVPDLPSVQVVKDNQKQSIREYNVIHLGWNTILSVEVIYPDGSTDTFYGEDIIRVDQLPYEETDKGETKTFLHLPTEPEPPNLV